MTKEKTKKKNNTKAKKETKVVKRKVEYEDNDCWMYVLILTTLTILLESLKTYTFKLAGVSLTYSIFLLPFVYFITNYITKKYDYKKTVAAIAISGVVFVSYSAIMSFALGEKLLFTSISGEFCGYVISQFINLTIYVFILNNTKSPLSLVFLNYVFSLIVYYMFYTLIYLNVLVLDTFWKGYFLTLIFQIPLCYLIAMYDIKIKKGKTKKESKFLFM